VLTLGASLTAVTSTCLLAAAPESSSPSPTRKPIVFGVCGASLVLENFTERSAAW
jgi:hypothetical protein